MAEAESKLTDSDIQGKISTDSSIVRYPGLIVMMQIYIFEKAKMNYCVYSLLMVAILCAVFAAAHATALLAAPIVSTGVSSSSRQQDAIGNYAFNYGIADGLGATNSRAEVGDAAGNKKGSYTLTDIDGRARRVDYVADALGFRASVNTNEPGTALSAPAAAAVVSPYAAPVAPVAAAPVAPVVAPAAPLLAAAAPLASYSSVIGHGAALAAPVAAYNNIIGYGAGLAAPVAAYSNVIGHGAALAAPYGLGLTKSIVY